MLNSAQMSDVKTKLGTAYEADHGPSAIPIPWMQILAIALQILQGCIPSPTPAKVKAEVADDEARDFAVRVAVFEVMGPGAWRRHNGRGISDTFKKVTPTLDDATVAAAID